MKKFTVMCSIVKDDRHLGSSTFRSTREGSTVNDDGSVEMSIGWPNFQVRIHLDDKTVEKLGNPEFLNVTIESVRDKPDKDVRKEVKREGE